MKKSHLTPITLAVALCAGSFSLSAATSDVVGAESFTIAAGNVLLAPAFTHPIDLQAASTGLVEGAGTTSISVGGLVAGAFDESPIYPLYYLEVLDGAGASYVFDVISNTGTEVVVSGLLNTDFGVVAGDSVAIRKHMTIADLTAGSDCQLFDAVTFYNSDNTSDTLFLTGIGWSIDFGTTDNDDRPIYPGSGIVTGFAGVRTFTTSGSVKPTPTQVPVYAGATNVIGTLIPVETGIANVGLETSLASFDAIGVYPPTGSFGAPTTYFNTASGMSSDFVTETTDTIDGKLGFVGTVAADLYWLVPAGY